MDIDSSMVLDYLIPDSPTDAGAILLWVFLVLLMILILVNIRMYLEYRKTSQKEGQQPQNQFVTPIKKSEEEPVQSYGEIRTKVDQLLERNNL